MMKFVNSMSRRRGTRALLIGAVVSCLCLIALARYFVPEHVLSRTFDARFEWDMNHGFTMFRVADNPQEPAGGQVWQFIVSVQVKPALAHYLRGGHFDHVTGNALVKVTRIVPFTLPESWGSDGLNLDTGVTALMWAADEANLGSVEKLLVGGVDVNARDWLGRTPLLHACVHGNTNPEVIKALLAAGADVNISDRGGITPLIAVATTAAKDRIAIIRQLLAAGADVNATDASGRTALMQAAGDGDIEAVLLLLTKRANVGVHTRSGLTALSLAEQYNHIQVIEALRRAGAQQ